MKRFTPTRLWLGILLFCTGANSSLRAQCETCERNLVLLVQQANAYADDLRTKEEENKKFSLEVERLRRDLDIGNRTRDRLISERGDLLRDKEELNDRLKGYEDQIRQINSMKNQINKLTKDKKRLEQEVEKLKNEVKELKERIRALENQLREALEKVAALEAILRCIAEFQEQRVIAATQARQKLDLANRYVNQYVGDYNEELPDTTRRRLIEEAWAIYQTYSVACRDTTCGTYQISYCDDFKKGRDHFNAARILAYNHENIVDKLGSDLEGKLGRMNELLLSELGQALAEDDYNVKSDCSRLIDMLPYVLVPERKADAASAEVLFDIKSIPLQYNKGNFAECISLYSRFNRFFELKEIKPLVNEIGEAKYSAGAILAWNLVDLYSYAGLVIDGSWLDKQQQPSLKQQIVNGIKLLKEVAEDKALDANLRKQAYIILQKIFQTR